MDCFLTSIQLLIHSSASFFLSYGIKTLHRIWYEIQGLNQEISYWNLAKVTSRVFQVIWNSFEGGCMAWFCTIIRLLIRLSASFSSYNIKMFRGIWYKLEDWIKRYLIQTYHRLSQEYFKSYRLAFRVALWLDLNNCPVTYSFHGVFFERQYQNVTWNLIQNWRIESTDILFKLTRSYLKSISGHIE